MRVPVNRIVPFSAVDGPGNRTAVFTQGCDFTCLYCHNPETMTLCSACGLCTEVCPSAALTMQDGRVRYDPGACVMCDKCIRICPFNACPRIRWMTPEEIIAEVKRNVPFIRGITLSGGECTRHRSFLIAMAALAHRDGLDILLDSNGGYDFSADEELTDAVDGVMLDVKAWNDDQHRCITGKGSQNSKRNLVYLANCGKLTEVRTVVVPELMDPTETVGEVSRTLVALGAENVNYKIICYRPMGVRVKYRGLRAPSVEELVALEELARSIGMKRIVRI